jgi:hypothetical protein
MRIRHLITILVLLAAGLLPSPAHAGGVVAVCDEAHLLAALAGGGTVTFACSGVITLSNTITIAADTTIDGAGQTVIISGNNAVRVFTVNSRVTLNLNGLTVADGDSGYPGDGGGIYNYGGTVTVSNSAFSGNHASGAGGAIFNRNGTVTVSNSTFSSNDAWSAGGGICNTDASALSVSSSIFSGNSGGGGYGGGIYNTSQSTLEIGNSTFSGNQATWGGGIYNFWYSSVIVSRTTFSSNGAGLGGGIYNESYVTLTVSESTFSGNEAWSNGGGLFNFWYGTVIVSNSTFSGNEAGSKGDGIYNENSYGTLTVSSSTFSGNNTAIWNDRGPVTLNNTVVANSQTGANCFGTITDGGGNVSYPDASCPGVNADPLLGPLQNNGGPTWTMALGPGSAAMDAGDDATCAAAPVNNLDQRGVIRPQGAHCDSGALEQLRTWLPVLVVTTSR